MECTLAMGHAAFDRVMDEERADAETVESQQGMWLQFWRPVSVSLAPGGKALDDTGYWVRRVSPEQRTGSELGIDYNGLSLLTEYGGA